MQRVLIVVPAFLPGYKSGGPIRSIANLVNTLDKELAFSIITRDREPGDADAYPGVQINQWNQMGGTKVFYIPRRSTMRTFISLLRSTPRDILYLNGCFSGWTITSLLLRRLKALPDTPVIVAPRGEFSRGAIEIKSTKKKAFVRLARITGLWRGVLWQASTDLEKADIQRELGTREEDIAVALNVPASPTVDVETPNPCRSKAKGEVRILFFSRIARKKNLDFALRLLHEVQGNIRFDIAGPIEDQAYWEECVKIKDQLPPSISVQYLDSIPHEQVHDLLNAYHLFLFPTKGENYAHVIPEALRAGCLVLISDQTPWRDLPREGVGWDLSLTREDLFRNAIETCVLMDQADFDKGSHASVRYAARVTSAPCIIEQNRRLFLAAGTRSQSLMAAR